MNLKKIAQVIFLSLVLPIVFLGFLMGHAHTVSATTWNAVVDDNFTRANTSTGGAGTTTGVGNNWTDVAGGIWNINSNMLQATNAASTGYLSTAGNSDYLLRPSGESYQDQRIVMTIPPNYTAGSSNGAMLRYQSGSKNYYLAQFYSPGTVQILIYSVVNNNVTAVTSIDTGVTYNSAHTYSLDFSAVGINATTLTAIATDVTASTTLGTATSTDSSASLQGSGQYGLVAWLNSAAINLARFQSYQSGGVVSPSSGTASFVSTGSTTASVSSTVASGGTPGYTYQWKRGTGSGGPYTNVSGATGLTLNDTGLTPATDYYYVLQATDAATLTATSNEVHIKTQPASLSNAIIVALGDSISSGEPNTGGVSPYVRFHTDLSANPYFASNIIYNRAVSGTQTSDWLPGGSNYNGTISQVQNQGANMAMIMLGTNDAVITNNVSGAQYAANIGAMVNGLRAAGVQKVFISYQPYIDYPRISSFWNAQSLVALQSYQADIDALDNGTTIRRIGYNPSLYATTQAAPLTYLVDGVHLTTAGINLVADKWAGDVGAIVATPPVISNISAGSITQTGATINWNTDKLASGQIAYGLTTSYGSTTTLNASLLSTHTQAISGLTAGTTYHYRITSVDDNANSTSSGDQTFTTTAVPVVVVTPSASTSGYLSGGGGAPAPVIAPAACNPGDLFSVATGAPCAPTVIVTVPSTPSHTATISINIKALQQYFNAHGFIVAKTGAGSPGHETNSFGPATKAALIKFQKAHGLAADGILGPITRALIAKLTANTQ